MHAKACWFITDIHHWLVHGRVDRQTKQKQEQIRKKSFMETVMGRYSNKKGIEGINQKRRKGRRPKSKRAKKKT